MKTKRLTQINASDPLDHQQKLQRALASRQTRISVAIIAAVAIELSSQPNGLIDQNQFQNSFNFAFDLLTRADHTLLKLQTSPSEPQLQ